MSDLKIFKGTLFGTPCKYSNLYKMFFLSFHFSTVFSIEMKSDVKKMMAVWSTDVLGDEDWEYSNASDNRHFNSPLKLLSV